MYTIAYFSKYNIEGGLGAGSSVLWCILNEKLCNDVVIYLPLCGFSLKIKKNVCLLYSSSLKKLEIINIFNIFFNIFGLSLADRFIRQVRSIPSTLITQFLFSLDLCVVNIKDREGVVFN